MSRPSACHGAPSDATYVLDQWTDLGTLGLRAYFRNESVARDMAARLEGQGFTVEVYAL